MIQCDLRCPKPPSYCYDRFSLFRVRSPLLTKSRLISLPRPPSMFHFRRFPPYNYLFIIRSIPLPVLRFPHSDICGSRLMCSSPQLIAACHVLLRLPVSRHSPCALFSLTSCFRSSGFLFSSKFSLELRYYKLKLQKGFFIPTLFLCLLFT